MTQILARRPAHMSITNMGSGVELIAQYNPTELNEQLSVAYTRQKVVGLSHTIPQYVNTENHGFEFTMRFDALDDNNRNPVATQFDSPDPVITRAGDFLLAARQFLLGMCYTRRGGQAVADGAPPRALFVWPSLASLTCKIIDLRMRHLAFNLIGAPTRLDVSVKLEEIRNVRLYGEDVDVNGTFRTDNPNPELGY